MGRVHSERIRQDAHCHGEAGKEREGKKSQRNAMGRVLLSKLSPQSLSLFNDLLGTWFHFKTISLLLRRDSVWKLRICVLQPGFPGSNLTFIMYKSRKERTSHACLHSYKHAH